MKIDPSVFHKLYGTNKPRVTYYGKDFLDYVLMTLVVAAVAALSYGPSHPMAIAAFALGAFAVAAFVVRHGVELRVPLLLRKPHHALHTIAYKLQNVPPVFVLGLALLIAENFVIAATPNLPHQVEWMRTGALALFYIHFLVITAYRTHILVQHLANRELVREVLMQTPWKRVINDKTNITLEILHAYFTGVLTHIVLIAPWFLVVTHLRFSLILLPLTCALSFYVHRKWLKTYNRWYYRDHWVGHNSELEFLYFHGTHHDAIPSGLIAVADNGVLEGFTRYTMGSPVALYNPLLASVLLSSDIKADIDLHQYIPGVGPRIPRSVIEVYQHSTHHYGRLEPYSMGAKVDQPDATVDWKKRFPWMPDEVLNSFKLDEALNGAQWNNPTHLLTLSLWDKYSPKKKTQPAATSEAGEVS